MPRGNDDALRDEPRGNAAIGILLRRECYQLHHPARGVEQLLRRVERRRSRSAAGWAPT